jgi:hypothetical protein
VKKPGSKKKKKTSAIDANSQVKSKRKNQREGVSSSSSGQGSEKGKRSNGDAATDASSKKKRRDSKVVDPQAASGETSDKLEVSRDSATKNCKCPDVSSCQCFYYCSPASIANQQRVVSKVYMRLNCDHGKRR